MGRDTVLLRRFVRSDRRANLRGPYRAEPSCLVCGVALAAPVALLARRRVWAVATAGIMKARGQHCRRQHCCRRRCRLGVVRRRGKRQPCHNSEDDIGCADAGDAQQQRTSRCSRERAEAGDGALSANGGCRPDARKPKAGRRAIAAHCLTEAGDKECFRGEVLAAASETLRFDPAYAVRVISDLVPNPFVARSVVAELIAGLEARGFDAAKIGAASGVIINALRLALTKERDERAETLFGAEVNSGRIQFRLRLDGQDWPMPAHVSSTEPTASPHLTGADGGALQRSLFSPVFRNELNCDEQNVAMHLDAMQR